VLRGHSDLVTYVAFSSDDRYIVSGSKDNTIEIWNAMIHKIESILTDYLTGVASTVFLNNNNYTVSGSPD
jgi:WD40 repeat protein